MNKYTTPVKKVKKKVLEAGRGLPSADGLTLEKAVWLCVGQPPITIGELHRPDRLTQNALSTLAPMGANASFQVC
jgi:hypothetical protein